MAGAVSGKSLSRVALVLQRPLDERDYKRFGIAAFLNRGIQVSVLDPADIIHPGIPFERSQYANHRDIEIEVVQSRRQTRASVAFLKRADLILNLCQGGLVTTTNLPVLRAISASGVPSLVNLGNMYPGHDRDAVRSTVCGRVRDTHKRRREIRLGTSFVSRLPPAWLGVANATFAVRGGTSVPGSRFVTAKTRIIDAHAMDYDIYMDIIQAGVTQRDIAVFVDEFVPYHSDTAMMGYDKIVEADGYYAGLRSAFAKIEEELGLTVVIAACPRAHYETLPDVFGGRDVVKGHTGTLIAQSRLVLGHRSTALAFAIMFNRPILQLATEDNYRHPAQQPYFDAYAQALGKPIKFHDNLAALDLSDAFQIDADNYAAFMAAYVKIPGSPERKYWNVVLDAVESAFTS